MVSRQETARPLLTPGEVMQLPPTDEIVLVSGCPPIRARKARYYEDRQLRVRVVSPPEPTAIEPTVLRPDDWSALTPVAAAAAPSAAVAGDDADGGIRREPTLPEHEQIAPEPGPPPEREFFFAENAQDDDTARTSALAARARRVARQAALDPDDGIAL
jgi:type IV secretion system protein VirD4